MSLLKLVECYFICLFSSFFLLGLVGCSSPAETGDEEVVVFDFGFGQQDTGQSDLGSGDVNSCDDTDGDGVCDEDDVCEGGDDAVDTDGDGIPDDCDCGGDGLTCDENASCVENAEGEVSCACDEGFEGDGFECADIDECLEDAACGEGATCINTAGAYDCACEPGYSSPDPFLEVCLDVDECVEENHECDPLTDCVNEEGGYGCTDCPLAYTGNGLEGCVDVDECEEGLYECDPLTDCINEGGGYACGDCPEGYGGTGESGCVLCEEGYEGAGELGCLDIDECFSETDLCSDLAACINSDGGYGCVCNEGFEGDGFECSSPFCDSIPPILIYEDSPGDHGSAALDRLGCSYVQATTDDFVSFLESEEYGVLVYSTNGTPPAFWDAAISQFVKLGGAAVVSTWQAGSPHFQSAMGFTWEHDLSEPTCLESVMAHPAFTQPFSVGDGWGDGIHGFCGTDDSSSINGGALTQISYENDWNGVGFVVADHEDEGAAIVRYNWGRTLMNGFLWSDFNGDEDGDGVPDIEELIANQVVAVSHALMEDFIYLPWDFYEFGESQAAMLAHSLRRGHHTDPSIMVLTECVDLAATGEYNNILLALESQGFTGNITDIGGFEAFYDHIFGEGWESLGEEALFRLTGLDFDVLLLPEQELCSFSAEAYGRIMLYALAAGARVVASGLANSGTVAVLGDAMNGMFGSGNPVQVWDGSPCEPFVRLDPDNGFWAGAPESNECVNATFAIDLNEGAGAVPMSVDDSSEWLTQIFVVPEVGIEGCDDNSIEQVFATGMVGCAGSVTYANRDSLCDSGYDPCTIEDWLARHSDEAPTRHYWTDSQLAYCGTASACYVDYSGAPDCNSECAGFGPFKVCAQESTVDPEGNWCGWHNCGWQEAEPNEYLGGGCDPTGGRVDYAGTLCCNN
jgi:hypothetical protein